MSFVLVSEQLIRLAVLCWLDLRRWRLVLPAAGLVLAHWALYAMIANPTYPLWSGIVVPLLQLRFGDYYLHYPQALIGLPQSGAGMGLLLDLLVAPVVAGWVAAGAAALSTTRSLRWGEMVALSRSAYATLFAVGLFVAAVWLFLYAAPLQLLLRETALTYRARVLLTHGLGLVPSLLLAPLIFVPAAAVVTRGSFVQSIRGSAAYFRRQPGLAVTLSLCSYLAGAPFAFLLQRSALLANRLRPEVIPALLAIESFVVILVGFFVVDAATRTWMARRGGRMWDLPVRT